MELMLNPQPLPVLPINVRAGTLDDLPFIDGLQKKTTKQVGWMPTKQFEGKIAAGHVLVAEMREERGEMRGAESSSSALSSLVSRLSPVGYLIGNDQYFKRDDVGIIYQINVVPGVQRGLIGATLLKAQFDRSAYGCRLYCCWCAQDIAANHFWAAMGFVPLAFRTGSAAKDRVHIFWQKRIRAGDEETPWWFPSQTSGGSIRSDRIVLPIPPGKRWHDEMPRIVPSEDADPSIAHPQLAIGNPAVRHGRATKRRSPTSAVKPQFANHRSHIPLPVGAMGGMRLGPPPSATNAATDEPATRAPAPKRKRAAKNDPKMVAAARELRDRWLEAVNRGEFVALPEARYDVSRVMESRADVALLPAA